MIINGARYIIFRTDIHGNSMAGAECYNFEQTENNHDNDHTEDKLNVIVKRRFVNDFINTPRGH